MASGAVIQELREQQSLKTSEIERISRAIANIKSNPDFYVSHSTLADIERGSVPSIHKLFSLAICLNMSLEDLLVVFGIDASELRPFLVEYGHGVSEESTVLARERNSLSQSNSRAILSSDETTLLRLNPQELASFPPTVAGRFDPRRYRYAIIGLKDDTMGELLPPGSVVEIDITENAVQVGDWKSLRERPIYLVWHTEGHSCCWCHLEGKDLTLLPYPTSRQPVKHFKTPREACVIGRVTKAWLPFNQQPSEDDKRRLRTPEREVSGCSLRLQSPAKDRPKMNQG